MALIDAVKKVCTRLGGRGWRALLHHHGLDITAADLADELAKDLPTIDRSLPGFEDFALEGAKGIEPGDGGRLAVAVFATEYRPVHETVHRLHGMHAAHLIVASVRDARIAAIACRQYRHWLTAWVRHDAAQMRRLYQRLPRPPAWAAR